MTAGSQSSYLSCVNITASDHLLSAKVFITMSYWPSRNSCHTTASFPFASTATSWFCAAYCVEEIATGSDHEPPVRSENMMRASLSPLSVHSTQTDEPNLASVGLTICVRVWLTCSGADHFPSFFET